MGYLYRHIRLDTNEVFYIGIGGFDKTDNNYKRAFDRIRRSNWWKKIVNKTEYTIDIIIDNLTFQECCDKEIEFIKLYGRKDIGLGTLVNMTNGGESGYGRICSEETKQKLRTRKISKKQLTSLLRIGVEHTELTKEKMRNNIHGSAKLPITINIDGVDYDSYNDASRKLNIPLTTLYRKYRTLLKDKK